MAESGSAMLDRSAVGAALLTVVLWASAFVGIRAVAPTLSPGSIALGRLAIGTLVLGALLARRGWQPITRRWAIRIVGSGLVWFAAYNLVLNQAERMVDAGTASMLVNTGPIFLAILAGLLLDEGFPPRLLVGCAIAFGGSLVIGAATSVATPGSASLAGIALCIAAALAYAVGVTLQKPVLRSVPALQVTWLASLTGLVVCLPFGPGLIRELGSAAPSTAAWLLYLGLFPTSIAFTTWAYALGRTPAGRLGSTTYLIPPIAVALAWLLLRQVPPWLALVGGAACIAGVVVARSTAAVPWRRPRPSQAG